MVLNRNVPNKNPALLESFQADGARILEPVSAGPGQTVAAGAKATDWLLDAPNTDEEQMCRRLSCITLKE